MTKEPGARRSVSDDPTLIERLFNLIETSFSGLEAASRGGPNLRSWKESSTPFIRFDGEVAIAHAGLVVGARLCSLVDIMSRIPQSIDEVEFYFSPDRFATQAQASLTCLKEIPTSWFGGLLQPQARLS